MQPDLFQTQDAGPAGERDGDAGPRPVSPARRQTFDMEAAGGSFYCISCGLSPCVCGDGVIDNRVRCDNQRNRKVNRLTIRQRRALQRVAERQQWYDRTHSHTALQRLRDAVTDALRLGV